MNKEQEYQGDASASLRPALSAVSPASQEDAAPIAIAELKCDGACETRNEEGHQGPVVPVTVHWGGQALDFNYCQTAIKEDTTSGFLVEIR